MTRDELCEWLIKRIKAESIPTVVGIDFAFSLPRSFLESHGFETVDQLWRMAATHGEHWLSSCVAPFWGRPGKKCPESHLTKGFRKTDREISVNGISPKSPFQIGGAGAVGTGSIRGMPYLERLQQEGFSIWPFDPPKYPLVVEIYPRLLTGEVHKSSAAARAEYLSRMEFASLPPEILKLGQRSEDAFDALVSAFKMREYAQSFSSIKQTSDAVELLEGKIWAPSALIATNP
jgi:hypothetical protein